MAGAGRREADRADPDLVVLVVLAGRDLGRRDREHPGRELVERRRQAREDREAHNLILESHARLSSVAWLPGSTARVRFSTRAFHLRSATNSRDFLGDVLPGWILIERNAARDRAICPVGPGHGDLELLEGRITVPSGKRCGLHIGAAQKRRDRAIRVGPVAKMQADIRIWHALHQKGSNGQESGSGNFSSVPMRHSDVDHEEEGDGQNQ